MKEKPKQILVDKDIDKGYGKFGYGIGLDDIILFIIGTLFICPQLVVLLLCVIYLLLK